MTVDGKATGDAIQKIGTETRQTTSLFARLRSSASATWARIRGGAQGAGDSTKIAAGSVANLTAQFNDIGVMMAAGQNPLQLALQQGTQISQVIGPMGAGAAVRALGTAFMGLINPVTLITVGTIAAASAMSNWLTSSKDEAESMEDVLDRLGTSIEDFADLSTMSLDDMRKAFGSAGQGARELHRELKSLALDKMLLDASKAGDSLADSLDSGVLRRAFADSNRKLARTGRDPLLDQIKAQIGTLGSADGIDQQIAAVKTLQDTLKEAAGGFDSMSIEQRALYDSLANILPTLMRIKALSSAIPQDVRDQADAAAKAYLQRQKDTAEAQSQLDIMRDQNAVQQASLRYGADSVQAENAKADAARRTLEEQIAGWNVSEDTKNELRDALEHQLDMEAAVRNTDLLGLSDQARLLATNMGIAADEAERYNAALNQSAGMSDVTPDDGGLGFGGIGSIEDQQNWTGFNNLGYGNLDGRPPRSRTGLPKVDKKTKTRKGGKSDRDAVAELIAREQEELDILREIDPVQKELIRNREVLKDATEAERTALAEVIGTRIEEQAALDDTQAKYDSFRSTGADFFADMAKGGDAATAAVARLGDALYDAAMQALLLGEGPFASLLGGGDSGGLMGQLASAIGLGKGADAGAAAAAIPANADGGMQYGPGASRADKGLTWISSGEFIVNARSTSRHRALLEAINSGSMGSIPAMANGGMFGARGRTGAAGLAAPVIQTPPGKPMTAKVEEETLPSGQRRARYVLSDAVADGLTAPGGKGRRTMRNAFGLTPRRPRR
ncbi:hypothetical protein CEW88_04965 [Alloyangia pacifica]|uniref:Bacteriophage tail tape measure N-terminal domain-containing protein n=1 Tax=Alloyangia pacifica TaxID=311180 RepID=A0A2U8HFM5_9RHOB|nr:hypothetical protein CEW88_04965 [Alloyangia pacifica]